MNAIEELIIKINEEVCRTNKTLQVIALIGDGEKASSYLAGDYKSQIDTLTALLIKNPELMAIVEDAVRYANETLAISPDLFPIEDELANNILDGYDFLKRNSPKKEDDCKNF